MTTDKEILEWYHKGFNDELSGNELLFKAYLYGKMDAYAGDEVSSLDYQTEKEILKKIK